jgi:hypothetical protein
MANAPARVTMGMPTTLLTTRSFMRMNRAARVTGSISRSAARQSPSYASSRQRLVENLRRLEVFGRHRQVGIQEGHGRPVEQAHRAASAATDWGDARRPGLGPREARRGQDTHREWAREREADQGLHDAATRQPPMRDLADHLPQRILVHEHLPRGGTPAPLAWARSRHPPRPFPGGLPLIRTPPLRDGRIRGHSPCNVYGSVPTIGVR